MTTPADRLVDEGYRARPMAANIETGPTTTARQHQWWRDGTRLRTAQQRRDPIPVVMATTRGDVEIDLAEAALVVIDMQRDSCDDDGFAHRHGRDTAPARALIKPINGLAAAFRARSVPVVFVGWGNRHDLADVPASLLHVYDPNGSEPATCPHPEGLTIEGTRGADFADGLVVEADDITVHKRRPGAFHATALDDILRNLGVTTLCFAGVQTDQCVYVSLIEAATRGYDCVLLADCTSTHSPTYCWDATVYNVELAFGFVASSATLIAALAATP